MLSWRLQRRFLYSCPPCFLTLVFLVTPIPLFEGMMSSQSFNEKHNFIVFSQEMWDSQYKQDRNTTPVPHFLYLRTCVVSICIDKSIFNSKMITYNLSLALSSSLSKCHPNIVYLEPFHPFELWRSISTLKTLKKVIYSMYNISSSSRSTSCLSFA